MSQETTDKLLKRRLFLQRYISSLLEDVNNANKSLDADLIALLRDFFEDATEREIQSLTRQRGGGKAGELMVGLRGIVTEQKANTREIVKAAVPALIAREVGVTARALEPGADIPSVRGVASMPVQGQKPLSRVDAIYASMIRRLVSDVTLTAANDPSAVVRAVRGRQTERFKDGLFYWRDDKLLRPNIDVIVNGAAANTSERVFESFKIGQVNHVATLDYRTCARCFAAEAGGPYELGKQPEIPVHPRCRCVSLPNFEGESNRRPFVRDDRAVKNIPKSERKGKIGQTRDNIEEFFARMSAADLKDYLGPGRYRLYRSGKITSIKQLVDAANLRPLRLDELPE